MSISGIGGGTSWAPQTNNKQQAGQNVPGSGSAASGSSSSSGVASSDSGDDIISQFNAYMKETPMQRWEDSWLKEHGLTKAQFDKLPAAQKKALEDEMKHDLEQKAKDAAAKGMNGVKTDILA